MKTVYAHIGMPKTGSKAFQGIISKNQKRLNKADLIWPETAGHTTWHREIFESKEPADFTVLEAEISSKYSPILSYEGGYIAPDWVIEKLSEIGRLKPLIFVRDPIDWLNSFYNQLIKAHKVRWAEIESFSIDKQSVTNWLDIESHLSRWAAHCEKASDLQVAKYHYYVDFKKVFENWTGVALKEWRKPSNPNPAADLGSLRVMSRIKQSLDGASDSDHFRVMEATHKRLRSGWLDTRKDAAPVFLTEAEQIEVRARYEMSYQRIFEKFGVLEDREFNVSLKPQSTSRNDLLDCDDTELKIVQEILASV